MVKKIFLWSFLILLFLGMVLGGGIGFNYLKGSYFNQLKSNDGRINFLVLGINGSGGLDKDLTDTIIFASVDLEKKKITLLSIPRDIWIKEIKAKINSAYHYGGIVLAKKTVSEVLDQPIHYYAVINFDSFEEIIDFIDGIRVNVERTFDDYKFPLPGKEKDLCNGDREFKCRYEHLHFGAGEQQMNGKTALKFVRSRNAVGEEGSDFSRSARQQKVLLAIKDKITSLEFYKQPRKIIGLLKLLQQEIITDVEPGVYGSLMLAGYDLNKNGASVGMTTLNGNLLVSPKYHYSKQWVLVPRTGGLEEIRKFTSGLLGK